MKRTEFRVEEGKTESQQVMDDLLCEVFRNRNIERAEDLTDAEFYALRWLRLNSKVMTLRLAKLCDRFIQEPPK